MLDDTILWPLRCLHFSQLPLAPRVKMFAVIHADMENVLSFIPKWKFVKILFKTRSDITLKTNISEY